MLSRDYDQIRMADILGAANVARSTFYQHFTGKDDLLCSVLSPILDPLARAGGEPEGSPHLTQVAKHVWQNRKLGRTIFLGPSRNAVVRNLAQRIEPALKERGGAGALPPAYVASVVANWQIASLSEWLSGRYRCDAETWAGALSRGTRGLLDALTSPGG